MQKLIDSQEIENHLREELFDYFSNGSLIVDGDFNIVYSKGSVPYLSFSDGTMTLNLFDNLDKNMQSQMRALLDCVLVSNKQERSRFIQLEPKDEEKFVKIIAQPFSLASHNLMILINFQEIEAKELFFGGAAITQAREEIKNISDALVLSKRNKALIKEELQESNEKLQTTVEELRASNEELQSTNEELLTSLDSNIELQNKLSLILESSMDGILGIDIHARHTFVNERASQLLGYSAQYLLGKNSHQIWHHTKPNGSPFSEHECPIVSTLEKGESFRGEDLFWCKDGSSIPVEFFRSPIRENGKITGAVISFHDITKEKALKSEFENVIRFAPNPIMLYDEDGKILMLNEAFEELTGYTLKELPTVEIWNQKSLGGKNITNTSEIDEFFKKSVREDMGIKKVTTKSGKELAWVCSLSPLVGVYNTKKILIASAMDITEIQEKEEMMLAQSRQAAMGDMIGMIAHQWRQPLSVISMVGNNLRVTLDLDGKVTSEEIYELADLLNEQTQYLSHTIDDFRTFFRPEKSKEKVVLCKVYEKLESMVRKLLENNQIALNFSGDCDMEFYAYQNELVQVLLNLLNNAKDVMKERNIKDAKIDIATSYTDDVLTIRVSDNGGGIDKSVIGKLGEPYVTTKRENGTGLGIYMSLMIVKKHFYGAMQWKNIDGGCCFTITLPRKKSEEGMA